MMNNSNIRPIDANALFDALRDNEFQTLCPLDEVDDVIAAAPTLDYVPNQQWISVKDRLPERDQLVLAYNTKTCESKEDIRISHGWCARKIATHWMPLPFPPKGE